MMRLKDIPPYTTEEWESDRQREDNGESLRCPACDHDEWFQCVPGVGTRPHERVCRVCGFGQKADGTPAYRCRLTAHVCLGPRPSEGKCPECGAALRYPSWHVCVTILRQEELGEQPCNLCSVVRTDGHVIPWAVEVSESGDVADWWSAIDVERLKGLWRRWREE
jgi:hypothetical protein